MSLNWADDPTDAGSSSGASASDEHEDEQGGDLPAVAEALAVCVRETLERGETAAVPGLGTFRVEHRESEMSDDGDEHFSISPPRDTVAFEPSAPGS